MSAPRLEHTIYRETDKGWEPVGRWFGSTPKNTLNDWVRKNPEPGRYKATGAAGEHIKRG